MSWEDLAFQLRECGRDGGTEATEIKGPTYWMSSAGVPAPLQRATESHDEAIKALREWFEPKSRQIIYEVEM